MGADAGAADAGAAGAGAAGAATSSSKGLPLELIIGVALICVVCLGVVMCRCFKKTEQSEDKATKGNTQDKQANEHDEETAIELSGMSTHQNPLKARLKKKKHRFLS